LTSSGSLNSITLRRLCLPQRATMGRIYRRRCHHALVFLTCFGRAKMSQKAIKKRLYEMFGGGPKKVTEAVP
jgi:hypothetical protein